MSLNSVAVALCCALVASCAVAQSFEDGIFPNEFQDLEHQSHYEPGFDFDMQPGMQMPQSKQSDPMAEGPFEFGPMMDTVARPEAVKNDHSGWGDLEGHNVYPPVAASCNENHMDVYGFFFQSLVKRKTWTPEGLWPEGREGWENVGSLSYTRCAVAAHQGPSTKVDVIITDNHYRILARSNTGKSWSTDMIDLHGLTYDQPLALPIPSTKDDVLVIVRGTNGYVYGKRRSNGHWQHSWKNLGGQFSGPLSGIVLPDGSVYLFVMKSLGNLYVKMWRGRWYPWKSLGYNTKEVPVVIPNGKTFAMVFRTLDAKLIFAKLDPHSRSLKYTNIDAKCASGPAMASKAYDHFDIFAAGADNKLMQIKYYSGKLSSWKVLSNIPITMTPSVVSRGSNIEVFAVQAHSEIRQFTAE